jgi:hypothetical protein
MTRNTFGISRNGLSITKLQALPSIKKKLKVQQHLQISFTNVWETFPRFEILELKHAKTIENQRMYRMTFFCLVS